MKILQVIPYFTFSRGGDVNVCYNLSKNLTSMGHEVTILTTTFEYDEEDTASINNLTMCPVEYKFNFALFIYSPDMKSWLEEHLREYDIVHLHELRSYQNNIVMDYARKYGVKYVLQPHASTPKHVDKRLFKEAYDFVYGNRIMRNASCVIAVSRSEEYYDRLMGAKDVEVVYNGMNLEDYSILPEIGTFKKSTSITSPYILYLGRMDKLKGIDHLIEAFSLFSESYPDYKLVIAGKISDYKSVLNDIIREKRLDDKVVFTGFVKEEDKISIYRDADVFVNPVKYMGGVSLTVFESLLAHTPVVVSPESGELVKEIGAGRIVDYGDVEAIKDAIIDCVEDKAKNCEEIRNAEQYIQTNLSWQAVTERVLKIYERVIG